uniref:RGS domain-containing protein n=1 Tax=Bursaphelenchus xylophilus TaxID=6326 RepID=A0A1I7SQN5_BURXY
MIDPELTCPLDYVTIQMCETRCPVPVTFSGDHRPFFRLVLVSESIPEQPLFSRDFCFKATLIPRPISHYLFSRRVPIQGDRNRAPCGLEKRPRPQQAHPPAAFQPQRQAEAARVAAVDAASPLVGGGVEQRRRVVAHVAATRHATTSSQKKEGPEELCSSSTWSSLSSASSGAVVGAAHQQQEEQQKYPAAPDYSPVSFQKVQKRKSGLHLFQRANSHSLEAKRRQAHLLHHQSSIQSHHQFAQSQPNHLEQSLTVSSTTTSTSTTSGPETTGSASIFPPPPHHPQTTTTRRAGDAAIPSPASAVSSPRRLKRLSSFFRRANSEAFESAGPYSTDAPGTADRGPTARTVGAGQQSHHQLTRQQSLGIQNITLDKENISPQSMPDSATDDQKVDLEKLLKSETARAPFQNFLQQQFCIENLNFYLAVEEYRKLRDANKRSEFGRHIYERHFTPNSIEPVNIDNATSKGIIECIQNENYSEEMYDVAQYQIFHLLKYDVWPRYLNSGGKAPGKEPEPKKECGGSVKKSGPNSGSMSARSANSAQLNTSAEKREKRKSFFRFLRRNKESSQDQSSDSCGPSTSSQCQILSSGVYGEGEPYAGSVGELNLSLSPAATKRRMTRERSVPAPTSRSVGNAPLGEGGCSSAGEEDTPPRKPRANNSPVMPASPLACSSKSIPTTTPPTEADHNFHRSAAAVATTPPEPVTSLLHDEKEPCSSCSNNAIRASAGTDNGACSPPPLFTGIPPPPPHDRTSSTSNLTPTFPRLPALYTSAVRSDKETLTPSGDALHEPGLKWQKADYV